MTLPTAIIAVDPGATCGVAFWSAGSLMLSRELPPMQLLDWVDACQPQPSWLIAYEQWRVTGKTARYTEQLDAPYVIGGLRWIAHRRAVPCEGQPIVKDGKGSPCTDKVLKALDWYERTPGGHQNDAHRQLYLALIKRGWRPPDAALEKIFAG